MGQQRGVPVKTVKSGESETALDIARAYFPLQQSQEELPNGHYCKVSGALSGLPESLNLATDKLIHMHTHTHTHLMIHSCPHTQSKTFMLFFSKVHQKSAGFRNRHNFRKFVA